jgi:endonuclease YncB( thermonuclease family)
MPRALAQLWSPNACRQYAGISLKDLLLIEREARDAKRGIWQGKFQEPSEWRKALKHHWQY